MFEEGKREGVLTVVTCLCFAFHVIFMQCHSLVLTHERCASSVAGMYSEGRDPPHNGAMSAGQPTTSRDLLLPH